MKYGKYIRKTKYTRKASKGYNSSSKRRRRHRRVLATFQRKLNTVAEKKTLIFACPNAFDTQAHTSCGDNTQALAGIFSFMFANLAQGAGRNQRVGNKIFIRNIVIKGEFFNLQGTNAATGIVGFWLAREKQALSVFGKTRQQILTPSPFTIIPDFMTVGWQCVRKKHGYVYGTGGGAMSNTPVLYKGTMEYNWHFKLKIRLFKTMHWQTASYTISDGMQDLVPIPWIDTQIHNSIGNGISNIINVRVTYTDV